jgi:hypothetical protein
MGDGPRERATIARLIMADVGQRHGKERYAGANSRIGERIRLPHEGTGNDAISGDFDLAQRFEPVDVYEQRGPHEPHVEHGR